MDSDSAPVQEAAVTPLRDNAGARGISALLSFEGGPLTRRIRSIDLFAGAGGLTLGFDSANAEQDSVRYEPVLAVEHDPAAALTYKTNFGVSVFD